LTLIHVGDIDLTETALQPANKSNIGDWYNILNESPVRGIVKGDIVVSNGYSWIHVRSNASVLKQKVTQRSIRSVEDIELELALDRAFDESLTLEFIACLLLLLSLGTVGIAAFVIGSTYAQF
jgi:hypothetical protein